MGNNPLEEWTEEEKKGFHAFKAEEAELICKIHKKICDMPRREGAGIDFRGMELGCKLYKSSSKGKKNKTCRG